MKKEGNVYLSFWIYLILITNSITAVLYLFRADIILNFAQAVIPRLLLILLGVLCIFNTIFAIYLFKWKKWAFWGFAYVSSALFLSNLLVGLSLVFTLPFLISIIVLYVLLQVKRDNISAWSQLDGSNNIHDSNVNSQINIGTSSKLGKNVDQNNLNKPSGVDSEIIQNEPSQNYSQQNGSFAYNDEASYDEVAKQLLEAYFQRHFLGGSNQKVISIISRFLTDRGVMRTLFTEHQSLATVAQYLMVCNDNPEIRGWGIDLFARTCNREDLIRVTGQLENETDVSVQQEIIAALTKFLRFRYTSDAEKFIVINALEGFFNTNPNLILDPNLGNAVKILNEELGN